MATKQKELEYKLKDYPLVKQNMYKHTSLHDFLEKASDEQLRFCEDFFKDDVEILFNESSAGTGKTMCSVACGYAEWLNNGKKLVFIIAPVSEDLGSRPGNQSEKELAYFMGLHDAIIELNMVPEQVVTEMLLMNDDISQDKVSECWVSQMSHLFLRGGNLKNMTVVINEAQNFKRGELKKVLTRLHSNSKCVMEGNFKQIDLKNKDKSGFKPYMDYFKQYEGSVFHHFTINYRSRIANFADEFTW